MKFKYAFLTTAMAVALVGCGQGTNDTTDTTTETEVIEETTLETPEDPTVGTNQPVGGEAVEGDVVEGEITADEAKAIAFEKAGVVEADVTDFSSELDEENGVRYYEVSFDANGQDYDYDIDALTGEIIGEDID